MSFYLTQMCSDGYISRFLSDHAPTLACKQESGDSDQPGVENMASVFIIYGGSGALAIMWSAGHFVYLKYHATPGQLTASRPAELQVSELDGANEIRPKADMA